MGPTESWSLWDFIRVILGSIMYAFFVYLFFYSVWNILLDFIKGKDRRGK